jgi:hypothetical protein
MDIFSGRRCSNLCLLSAAAPPRCVETGVATGASRGTKGHIYAVIGQWRGPDRVLWPETLLRMRLKVPRTGGNVDLRVGRRRQIDNVTNLDAFETSSAAEEEALDAVCAAIEYVMAVEDAQDVSVARAYLENLLASDMQRKNSATPGP